MVEFYWLDFSRNLMKTNMNILRGQRQLLSIIKLRKATKLFTNRDSCYLALIVFKTLVFDDITQHLSPLTRYQSILTQWNTCNILIWDEYRRTCIHIIFAKIMYIWRKFATMYMHMYIDRGKQSFFPLIRKIIMLWCMYSKNVDVY